MTVKEIARIAGVSIGTVDRVLHKRGRASTETRERVQSIIDRYHFVPDPIARRFKRNRDYHFYALLPRPEQDSGYWGQILAGIEKNAEEIRELGVNTETLFFDRFDRESLMAGTARALASGCDGIVLAPVRPEITLPFVSALTERGVPYVFLDADLPDTSPLCAIGQDSFRCGCLAGRLMRLFTGNSAKPFAVLDPHGEDFHIIRRRDGFRRFCGDRGIPVIVREYSDVGGNSFTKEDAALFLREHPDIAGVFITNCFTHLLAEAVREERPDDGLCVIGCDLIPRNHGLLLEGAIDAIIAQRPEEQGRLAVTALFRSIVLEKPVERQITIPLDIYIRENAPALP